MVWGKRWASNRICADIKLGICGDFASVHFPHGGPDLLLLLARHTGWRWTFISWETEDAMGHEIDIGSKLIESKSPPTVAIAG